MKTGLWVGGALLVVAAAPLAHAAELTDVADAADTIHIGNLVRDNPFDLRMGADYALLRENGKISREPIDRPGLDPNASNQCVELNARDCRPVDELRYKRSTSVTKLNMEIGIFHDLSLTVGWSYIISQSQGFRYAKGVDASNSTVDGTQFGRLFAHNAKFFHKGSGPLDLGLRFAPLSDERDDSKPMWVLYTVWASPYTTETYNPVVNGADSNPAPESKPAPVGDGMHRLTFGTALSKRVANFGLIGIDPNANRRGYMEPYIDVSYVLPIAQPSRTRRENNIDKPWGKRPSQKGMLNFGVEMVPFEDLKQNRKVTIDLGMRSAYVSEGRNWSELSDALNELTYTEQYLYVGGLLGFYAQLSEFLRLRAGLTVGYNTEHFLTNEDVGTDNNGDNQVIRDTPTTPSPDDVNPYFCGFGDSDNCNGTGQYSYDQTGFRFKDEEHVLLNFFLTLLFTF